MMIKINGVEGNVVKVNLNGNKIQGEVVDIDHNIVTVAIKTYYRNDIIFVKDKIENVELVTSDFKELMKVRGLYIR